MYPIRTSRSNKLSKKNKKLVLLVKIVAILYLTLVTASYLTSNTGAYFIDTDNVNGRITAGIWKEKLEDKEVENKDSLRFSSDNQKIDACGITTISVQIKNNGNDMEETTVFDVYYSEFGNPEAGVKVAYGIVPKLSFDQTATLTIEANKPGNYKYKVQDTWSGIVAIQCNEKKTSEQQNKGEDTSTGMKKDLNVPILERDLPNNQNEEKKAKANEASKQKQDLKDTSSDGTNFNTDGEQNER